MQTVVEEGRGLVADRSLYYASKFVSQTAQNLMWAALFVTAGTGQNAGVGLSSLLIANLIPSLLLGLLGGAVVDRFGPARGLVLGAGLRIAIVAGGLLLLGGPFAMWIIAGLYSAASQIYTPAEMAMVRTIQRRSPGRAHAMLVALQYAGQGFGMLVLGPALYFLGGPMVMLGGAVAGFVLQVPMVALLSYRLRDTPACETQPSRAAFNFSQTCRFFANEGRARYAIITLALKTVVSRGLVIALPLYLAKDMGLGSSALVYLGIPAVAGVVLGLLWSARSLSLERAQETMRWSVIGMIAGVFALAVLDYGLAAVVQFSEISPIARLEASMNTTFAVALPAAFLLGLTLSAALISARVALTETAPRGQQARVFATQETLTETLLLLPVLLTGIGTEVVGARATLAAIGMIGVFAVIFLELPRFQRVPATPIAKPDAAAMPIA